MKTRKIVIGAVLVVLGLPVLLILIVVVSVSVLDRANGTIISSGKPRSYLLHVPPSYDRAKPTPLVISMHGAAGWVRSDRGGRHGGGGAIIAMELVHRPSTGADDCVSWDG